jgi:hypothetical protein
MAAIALSFPNPAAWKAILKYCTDDAVIARRGSAMMKGNTVTANLDTTKNLEISWQAIDVTGDLAKDKGT